MTRVLWTGSSINQLHKLQYPEKPMIKLYKYSNIVRDDCTEKKPRWPLLPAITALAVNFTLLLLTLTKTMI